ncbi:lysylphosphatidylglycerol synthase transmembrane domain-containing protein [Streptomyces sp. R21]|uniref:Lysylphosphatidylglycerol synthase transmembrane domain-containing protein n=1 Tax=Streptomyces sp. R21 TaxID=3238627 RepID=A0AB39PLZ0_9ACTN
MRQPAAGRAKAAKSAKAGALRTHLGTIAGAVILTVLLWRLGTGVFLDGLRRIDGPTLLAALALGLLTTALSAWRWCVVARALGLRLPLGAAVADYYRALFLNAALPGGVLGDVHRAVRHGQSAGDVGRGVRAVVLERTAGQVVLVAVGVTVLLTQPSPVLSETRRLSGLLALGALGGLAVVAAVRMGRARGISRRGRAVRAALTEARRALLARCSWPGVLVSSTVVLAGHLAMFLLAARVAESTASAAELLPLALLALLAMGLPLNIGGWGPREGVTAWAFGAAGLGATTGLTVAVVYGVLSFVASLPGVVVLVVRWYAGLRNPRTATEEAAVPEAGHEAVAPDTVDLHKPSYDEHQPYGGHEPHDTAELPEPAGAPHAHRTSTPGPTRTHTPPAPYPRSPPAGSPTRRHGSRRRGASPGSSVSEVTKEKYAPKDSASPASSSLPLSAEASDGRPMTPDSV